MRRLGDFIRQVDVRNKDVAVTNLKGLSMTKEFRESTSNIVGTDLSKYKIVHPNVFAFDTMSAIRVHRVPIILNDSNEDIIISPAYITFEVIDEDRLLSQYLKYWVRRSEFDRYADFKSDAAIRGGYGWEELCDTMIAVPPIEEQRAIVARHKAIEHKIDVNYRLIAALEETARTIYRHTFIDNIDPENLPQGWRIGTISEIIDETLGGDWGKDEPIGNYLTKVRCLRGADITSARNGNITEAPIRFILNKNLANRQLQKNDLVIEMSGGTPTQSTGRCVLINDELLRYSELPYICSNFCKTIKPSNGYATFLYATLQDFMQKGIFFKYENSSNGIQNLDLEALSKEEGIIIAPINLIAEFSKHYNSISLIQMRLGHEISKLQNLTKALL